MNCTKQARLVVAVGELQIATDAIELVNGRWAVIADHPSMKGEQIAPADIKDRDLPPQAQAAPKVKT